MAAGLGIPPGKRGNAKIHQGRQDKHIEGTNNYRQQKAGEKNPSILTEDADKLLKAGAGRGVGTGKNKERVDFDKVIGKYYDRTTNQYYDTTRAMIHYDSNRNAHIVPARPKGMAE